MSVYHSVWDCVPLWLKGLGLKDWANHITQSFLASIHTPLLLCWTTFKQIKESRRAKTEGGGFYKGSYELVANIMDQNKLDTTRRYYTASISELSLQKNYQQQSDALSHVHQSPNQALSILPPRRLPSKPINIGMIGSAWPVPIVPSYRKIINKTHFIPRFTFMNLLIIGIW